MSVQSPKRLFVVDAHPLTRLGLRALIAESAGLEVIGEAVTRSEARDGIRTQRPDLVLAELRLQREDGFELLSEFRALNGEAPRLLVVSALDEMIHSAR